MLFLSVEVLDTAQSSTGKKPRQQPRCPVCNQLKKGHKFVDCPRNERFMFDYPRIQQNHSPRISYELNDTHMLGVGFFSCPASHEPAL